jgi:hypothetical protein
MFAKTRVCTGVESTVRLTATGTSQVCATRHTGRVLPSVQTSATHESMVQALLSLQSTGVLVQLFVHRYSLQASSNRGNRHVAASGSHRPSRQRNWQREVIVHRSLSHFVFKNYCLPNCNGVRGTETRMGEKERSCLHAAAKLRCSLFPRHGTIPRTTIWRAYPGAAVAGGGAVARRQARERAQTDTCQPTKGRLGSHNRSKAG